MVLNVTGKYNEAMWFTLLAEEAPRANKFRQICDIETFKGSSLWLLRNTSDLMEVLQMQNFQEKAQTEELAN